MRLLRIFLLQFLLTTLMYGQGERGAIGAAVTDHSGSAIPGATIVATHIETNVEVRATTTDTGVYRMPYLPLGAYRITATASGFKTATVDNLTLRVAQTLNVDLKL